MNNESIFRRQRSSNTVKNEVKNIQTNNHNEKDGLFTKIPKENFIQQMNHLITSSKNNSNKLTLENQENTKSPKLNEKNHIDKLDLPLSPKYNREKLERNFEDKRKAIKLKNILKGIEKDYLNDDQLDSDEDTMYKVNFYGEKNEHKKHNESNFNKQPLISEILFGNVQQDINKGIDDSVTEDTKIICSTIEEIKDN